MSYTFLKSADHHEHRQDPRWWAISEGRIQELAVSDSYDNFGQNISNSDAGDFIEILTPAAADAANDAYNDDIARDDEDYLVKFTIGDNVSAYDYSTAFDAVIENCEEGKDYTLELTMFHGFNYWDGNNYKTIVVDSVMGGETHEIECDDEIIARLNEAMENEEFESEGFGTKTCRFKDAEINYSQYASAWEYAEITLDNEFEEA